MTGQQVAMKRMPYETPLERSFAENEITGLRHGLAELAGEQSLPGMLKLLRPQLIEMRGGTVVIMTECVLTPPFPLCSGFGEMAPHMLSGVRV